MYIPPQDERGLEVVRGRSNKTRDSSNIRWACLPCKDYFPCTQYHRDGFSIGRTISVGGGDAVL